MTHRFPASSLLNLACVGGFTSYGREWDAVMPGGNREKQGNESVGVGEHSTIPERHSGNESALLANAVVDGHIAAVY